MLHKSASVPKLFAENRYSVEFKAGLISVTMLKTDWVEMGRPDEITVTIEPGDTINAD